MTTPLGTFCLVLHSHLPWLARHGRWPVGEEWLYQAWAHSYLPLVRILEKLADEGSRRLLTLGITPVLAAQLEDPHCLRSFHHWLGDWQNRAHQAAWQWRHRPGGPDLAAAEHRASARALENFEKRWRHGAGPVLRPLIDSNAIELIGGPATHPFQPLLDPALRDFGLRVGLTDAQLRFGRRPAGIWAPECAYAPGLEKAYSAAGVRYFVADGSALADVSAAYSVADSEVVCFGRDVRVSDRVWSGTGYPGHPDYRDFHTFDHAVGLKSSRITGQGVDPQDKEPYLPGPATRAVERHVEDFVTTVVERLGEHRERRGGAALVVAAFDTELFGHWWAEGPLWLEQILRRLPQAGVRVTTLGGALDQVAGAAELPETSWGVGNDWRVWSGPAVSDLAESNRRLQDRLLGFLRRQEEQVTRDPVLDQVLREALLALSSDWAFMITHGSSAQYARERAEGHTGHVHRLLDLLDAARREEAEAFAHTLREQSFVFGHLDARGV